MHVRPPVLCIVLQSSQNIASYFLHHDCFETRSARVKTRHRIKTQNTQKPNCIWWTFKPRTEPTHTEGDNCDRHSTESENLFADYSTCCSISLIIVWTPQWIRKATTCISQSQFNIQLKSITAFRLIIHHLVILSKLENYLCKTPSPPFSPWADYLWTHALNPTETSLHHEGLCSHHLQDLNDSQLHIWLHLQ